MKKMWIVLLALGLIAAFAMPASAATAKFSGQYYVAGTYDNNRTLEDKDVGYSRSVFWNRLRVQTVFNVAEGLDFTMRFDAFEKQWGAVNRSSGATEDKGNSGKVTSLGTTNQENIEMEYGYVTFKTAVGQFDVGYQAADEWGTVFANTPGTRPRIKYAVPFGPVTLIAIYEKVRENDSTALSGAVTATAATRLNADADNYMLAGIYKFKGGDAGLLYKYTYNAAGHTYAAANAANYTTKVHCFLPYMKATFGPIYMEAELVWLTGKAAEYDGIAGQQDVDKDGLGAYIKAQMKLGPAYVGAQYGFSSGPDINDATKDKSGPASTTSWTPTLFFLEANMKSYFYGSDYGGRGTVPANNGVGAFGNKQNLHLFNIYGGFNPTPKLNLEAALSFMRTDKNVYTVGGVYRQAVSNSLGTEFDLKATYKIYDNLTYMVGAGYLWTGDYFKGNNEANKTGNDYVLVNKLTLNF